MFIRALPIVVLLGAKQRVRAVRHKRRAVEETRHDLEKKGVKHANVLQGICFFLLFFETVLQSEMSSDVLLWRLIHQMRVYIKESFGSDVDRGGQAGGCTNNTSD